MEQLTQKHRLHLTFELSLNCHSVTSLQGGPQTLEKNSIEITKLRKIANFFFLFILICTAYVGIQTIQWI